MRNVEREFRDFTIARLKDAFNVSAMKNLPKKVRKEEIPDLPPKIVFLSKRQYSDVVNGLHLVQQQVDRLFASYDHNALGISVGKWTQDYIEGFFGIARSAKGQHDAVNLQDLFSTLKFMQHTGLLVFVV